MGSFSFIEKNGDGAISLMAIYCSSPFQQLKIKSRTERVKHYCNKIL